MTWLSELDSIIKLTFFEHLDRVSGRSISSRIKFYYQELAVFGHFSKNMFTLYTYNIANQKKVNTLIAAL